MWASYMEQWKPGDQFVIREPTDNGVPEPRFYRANTREIPDPYSLTRYIPRQEVNLILIYTVTAVYEETTWTAIRFENKDEDFYGRRGVHIESDIQQLVELAEGPPESLWIIARHLDIPFCRHVRMVSLFPRPTDQPASMSRSRSR